MMISEIKKYIDERIKFAKQFKDNNGLIINTKIYLQVLGEIKDMLGELENDR